MRTYHPVHAHSARSFGRKAAPGPRAAAMPAPAIGDDARLFATTFAAGFLFVSLLIA